MPGQPQSPRHLVLVESEGDVYPGPQWVHDIIRRAMTSGFFVAWDTDTDGEPLTMIAVSRAGLVVVDFTDVDDYAALNDAEHEDHGTESALVEIHTLRWIAVSALWLRGATVSVNTDAIVGPVSIDFDQPDPERDGGWVDDLPTAREFLSVLTDRRNSAPRH